MSIARGLTKAAKAAKKQSRGLTGNRNSQGDFMPEELQPFTNRNTGENGVVTPELQQKVDTVKAQIDEIDAQLEELHDMDTDVDIPGYSEEVKRLNVHRAELIEDLVADLNSANIELPPAVEDMFRDIVDKGLDIGGQAAAANAGFTR
jgi:paraquat-inducible protein B